MPSRFSAFLYNEADATRELTIATTALRCDRDPDTTRRKLVATVENIIQQHPKVDLLHFGEMTLGWYMPGHSREYDLQASETIPGEMTQALAVLAKRHGVYISFGLSERDGESLYNTQVLLNPHGDVQAVHRKRNLKHAEAQAGYQPGPVSVTETEIKGIRTALVICSDTASLHTMRALMRGRYELILHSLADDDRDDFVTTYQARMYDAWFVTANRYGTEKGHHWPGLITVSDPMGVIRATKVDGEQTLVATLCFAEPGGWFKRVLRSVWVKVPILFHVLKHWKQAKSYL